MKATNEQIHAWAGRHCIVGSITAIREAFEDAQTLVQETLLPKPLTDDTQRIDALAKNYWDLRCFSMSDDDVGWQVIEHHMAKPQERIVAEVFCDDPRQAIDAAIESASNIKPQPDHFAGAGKVIDAEREIQDLAKALIDRATTLGVVVTIERQPLTPLAMGNACYVVGVRPKRGGGAS